MRWGVNSVLGRLCEDGVWQEFLEYKLKKALLDKREAALLRAYVENRRYRQIAAQIAREEYQFSDPQKCLVNKMGTQKKRVVYTFGEDETMVLKLLAYLLYEYDAALPNNCYSFRQKIGAKNAFWTWRGARNSWVCGVLRRIFATISTASTRIFCRKFCRKL